MKKTFLVAIAGIITVAGWGQSANTRQQRREERKQRINQLIKQEEEGALIFNKQGEFGIKLNTDGYGIFYEHGKYKTINKTNLWWIELGERKNAKEEKRTRSDGFFYYGNPFIFGKQNNFYYLKGGLGQQYMIGGKGNRNGVAVSAIYGGGFALGMLKPYYLSVVENNAEVDIKYEDNPSLFITPSAIIGSAGPFKGFGQIDYVPGVHARLALRFDYGRYNDLLSALEVGVNAEYYTKNMPIMVTESDKKFFFNAHIALVFGKRK